jgi:hypothetical protein
MLASSIAGIAVGATFLAVCICIATWLIVRRHRRRLGVAAAASRGTENPICATDSLKT